MKFGFLSGIGEITPSIFSGLDAVNKARIFINLYNCCAGRELKIPLVYASMICVLLKIIAEVKFQTFVSPQTPLSAPINQANLTPSRR